MSCLEAPTLNRDSTSFPHVDHVPGPCINYPPFRTPFDDMDTFGSLVAQIQANAVAAIPYQHLGFRDIIRNWHGLACVDKVQQRIAISKRRDHAEICAPCADSERSSTASRLFVACGPGCRTMAPSHAYCIRGAHDTGVVTRGKQHRKRKAQWIAQSSPIRAHEDAGGTGATSSTHSTKPLRRCHQLLPPGQQLFRTNLTASILLH